MSFQMVLEKLERKCLKNGTGAKASEFCYKIIQSKKYVKIFGTPHLINGQTFVMFTVSDVTYQRRINKQREVKQQNMLQLASIVHDLKTPLNCINSTIKMMKPDLVTDEVSELALKNINISFEFIFGMIEDIQDMAKFDNNQNFSLNPELFNIRTFLDDIAVLFEEQCKFKSLDFIVKIKGDVPEMISSDPKRCKQIMMNLISNALKFTV